MEFQFLGTSSGAPTKERNVSGLALKLGPGRPWALVDCGEGTQHQILQTGFSLEHLAAVFITHMHGDHWYGLPGLLASAGLNGRRGPLTLVGPTELADFLTLFREKGDLITPYEIRFVDVAALPEDFTVAQTRVTAHALSHRAPTHGFRFEEIGIERRLDTAALAAIGLKAGPKWGALQAGETVPGPDGRPLAPEDFLLPARAPRVLVVAGDNDTPSLLAEACDGAAALIHEATYTAAVAEKVGPEPRHASAASVAEFASAVATPALILTHFSARYRQHPSGRGADIEEIREEAAARYTGALFLASDFDRFAIAPDGALSQL